jgi:hypothetical protein
MMVKKNIIWFSELDPDYLEKNTLLNKLQKDSKLEIKNIRYCFEPERRPETMKSIRSKETHIVKNQSLTYEAPPEMLFRESYYADGVIAVKHLFFETIYQHHLKDIHCPILTFSEESPIPNHILFVVTNHPDSVISIKQFCCVFENLCKNAKITLLILDDGEGLDKPDEKLLVNYIRKWNNNIGVYKEQDWYVPNLLQNLEFDDKTLTVMSRNLVMNCKTGAIPDLILNHDKSSLFIGYTYY